MRKKCGLLLTALLLFAGAFGQQYRAVLSTSIGKVKGRLIAVTDSGLSVQMKRGVDVFAYSEINRIKFIRIDQEPKGLLLGGAGGAAAGAIVGSIALSKGKQGEPKALSGVVGGIGGGLLGAIVGGAIGIIVHNKYSAKKITIVHTPEFYRSLPQLLTPFVAKAP